MDDTRARETGTSAARRSGWEPTEEVLRGLEEEARVSQDHVVDQELSRRRGFRIGIAVSADDHVFAFAPEVLVDSSDPLCAFPRERRGTTGRVETALARRGYARTRLDNGWLAYGRSLPRGSVTREWRFLRGLVEVSEARTIRMDGEDGAEEEGVRWRQ